MKIDGLSVTSAESMKEILGTTNVPRVIAHSKPRSEVNNDLFRISDIIDEFRDVNAGLMAKDGLDGIIGTSNPYQVNLFSDLILNPSSVSISEFQKMAYTMPALSAGLTILRLLVISKFGPYNHENEVYKKFINNMLDNMLHSMSEINENILTCLYAGFSLGEKRYYSDGRYVYIIDIEPRPAQSILFRVDSQGHLKDDGIIQYYFNNLWTGYGNMLSFNGFGENGFSRPNPYAARGDFDYPFRSVWAQPMGTVIIPKHKCVHFAYKGIDGLTSPYGRSPLRAAYDSYLVTTEMTRINRNAANFKASPVPVVIIRPNQANTTNGLTAIESLHHALSNLGSQTGGNPYLLVEGIKDESISIDHLDTTSNIADLVNLTKYYGNQQLLSIFLAPELMGLADHGSNALGEEQHDLLDKIVTSIANKIKKTVWIDQIVKPMLQINFNEQENFGSFDSNENVSSNIALNIEKGQFLASQGIKLKSNTLLAMMDLDEDAMESDNNPVAGSPQEDVKPAGRSRYAG